MEGLETESGPCDFLDETVVLLDDIVQILYPQYFNRLVRSRKFQANVYPLETC